VPVADKGLILRAAVARHQPLVYFVGVLSQGLRWQKPTQLRVGGRVENGFGF
jgi:hypothetical protein